MGGGGGCRRGCEECTYPPLDTRGTVRRSGRGKISAAALEHMPAKLQAQEVTASALFPHLKPKHFPDMPRFSN